MNTIHRIPRILSTLALCLAAFGLVVPAAGAYDTMGWTYAPWTSDADSGITSDYTYLVAVNLGGPAADVNGIAFQASAYSGPNFAIGGAIAAIGDAANNVTSTLATAFIFAGVPRTVTLYNLSPTETYKVTFFGVGWDPPGGRVQTFDADGDSIVLDEDFYGDNNGITISYVYEADASGSNTFTITPNAGPSFHMYALANRVAYTLPQANMRTFGPGALIAATNIAWSVPYGSAASSLSPTYTLSSGATCDIPSGTTTNFTSPVTYTVISSDNAITNIYTVTVTVLPALPFVDITNIVGTITEMNTTQYIAGTNSEYVVGGMTWTNSLGGGGTLDTVPGGWSFTVDLSPGNNVISVGGTNYAGDLASDTVTVFHSSSGVQLPVTNGVALWVDAAQIISLTNGQQVETWQDMSGAGNNAIRQSGSSAGYPMYVTNELNGQPVVRFNSPNGNPGDYFRFNRISTIRTVFWVVKESAGLSDYHYLLGDEITYHFHRAATPNGPMWNTTWTSPHILNGTTKLMGVVTNGTTTAIPSNQFQVISLVTVGDVQANQITQDRTGHGSWQGDIAEIIIYTTALTDNEEMQVGSYLAAKYALPTVYPALAYVDITNIVGTTNVPFGTASIDIIGTNNEFTVDMWWNNSGGGGATLDPAPGQWNFTATLVPGANIITVSGSNATGNISSDSVTVNVIPEPAAAAATAAVWCCLLAARKRTR